MKQTRECFLVVAQETELGQAEHEARFVEQAHDDALAMIGRNRGNAKIDWFPFDFDLNPSVLGQSFFCDAHRAGHNLEPADNGGLQTLWRRLHFLKNTIDPEPDTEFLVERFEMNIARAGA